MGFFKGLKKGQKFFGDVIAGLINSVLLSIVYFLGIGLTSIFAKVLGKEFLELYPDKNAKTYWTDLDSGKKPIKEYFRQF